MAELIPFEDEKTGKWGYEDENGEAVIEPQFDEAWDFSEGLALVKFGDKWGWINKEGKFVINPQFDAAYDFSEGLARIMISGKWGYINKKGKIVINLQFDDAEDFSEGLAEVEFGGERFYINKEGEIIEPEGKLFPVEIKNKHGYIDKKFRFVIEPQFDAAYDFSEGLAVVEIGGKYG